jgi:hypothetical protein
MLNTINYDRTQAAFDRVADTERHLRRHGAALCDLFNVFDAPSGFDALCDLHGIYGNQNPDAVAIKEALQEIERSLSMQTTAVADNAARHLKFDASAALRWHGARISELLARFHRAS